MFYFILLLTGLIRIAISHESQQLIYPVIYNNDLSSFTENMLEYKRYLNEENGLNIEIGFVNGRKYLAKLELNRDLMVKSGLIETMKSNGYIEKKFNSKSEKCHFNGRFKDEPKSLLTLSICNGMVKLLFFIHYFYSRFVN